MQYSSCGDECGRSLISMQPFTVVKCLAWLVSKESPHFWGCKSSYTEICYSILLLPPVIVSLQYSAQKTLGLQNPLFPIFWEDWTIGQECPHMVKSTRECDGWPVSCQEPLDATPPPLGSLANKEIFWPILHCLSFTFCWFKMIWK